MDPNSVEPGIEDVSEATESRDAGWLWDGVELGTECCLLWAVTDGNGRGELFCFSKTSGRGEGELKRACVVPRS